MRSANCALTELIEEQAVSANIFNFTCVETVLDEHYTPGPSHAKRNFEAFTLCGLSSEDYVGGGAISSLAYVDGHVSCDTCMEELRKLNLVGTYAGPLAFVKGTVEIEGVLLEDFGWGVFDHAYEHFFAYGHHEPGVVLGLARKLSRNKLIGWEEHKTTIYAHWLPLSPQPDDNDRLSCCYRTWRQADKPDDVETLQVVPFEVTVIRFEAWPLLQEWDGKAAYDCLWYKAWYEGSTKLGRAATPADIDFGEAPGFIVYGKLEGNTEESCLEWPTPDFDLAIRQMYEWHSAGAADLQILNYGLAFRMEELTPNVVSLIQHGLRVYGCDTYLFDILEHGVPG